MIALLVIIVTGFILHFYTGFTDGWFDDSLDRVEENVANDTSNSEINENQTNQKSKDDQENPFNQKMTQLDMTDERLQDYIHKMSHQKVIAEDKWGFYEITEDRINWLFDALENEKVKDKLKHLETYQEILVRWSEEDFSEVDKDHNAVWRLQGGNVGIATGILSKEAEEKYIKNTKEDS